MVIEAVEPCVDGGRFPVKRVVGEMVEVEADLFTDGHDAVSGRLLWRHESEPEWSSTSLSPLVNDRWRAAFKVDRTGSYVYAVEGWIDHFKTWVGDLAKRVEADQDVAVDLEIGAGIVRAAAALAPAVDRRKLEAHALGLLDPRDGVARALSAELEALMGRHPDRRFATRSEPELAVSVERKLAGFSAWYELFPRSAAAVRGRHGTFKDVEKRLPYIHQMGFDILYLPPIHPIGSTFRKGRNNRVGADPTDPGSPWAIGSAEGGHKAIHAQLGTLVDFRRLVKQTRRLGMELALDIAFQCSPDHPWVKEHPDWFVHRPDGSIQYAENPPKKYQDIYPLNFETDDWRGLWEELKSVITYWIDQGVEVFRVDNPHTKAFPFWEWCIAEVRREHPDVIFLAEAFTRPKLMYRLAKLGFSQSYTYFTWRNAVWELTEYFNELNHPPVSEYFRPNAWPNTPDILHEYLQAGGPPAFAVRLVLAATLAASYGIYGPAFELGEHVAVAAGKEEYLNSEKYEVRHWDLDNPASLKGLITTLNTIRRQNTALQGNRRLRFHQVDNDRLIAYSKASEDGVNVVLVVVNLDPNFTSAGWIDLALDDLGLQPGERFQVDDLLNDAQYLWQGSRNYVELNPLEAPAHVFQVRRSVREEAGLMYFE